jgi:hypothetical protein
MQAIYPFVGGTTTQHKYNLKDPRDLDAAFRIQFFGGITHSSNGVLPNGTNGYADTKFIPYFNIPSPESLQSHFSTYFRTTGNGYQSGANIIYGTDGDTFAGGGAQFLLNRTSPSTSAYALNINAGPNLYESDFTDTNGSGLSLVNRVDSLIKVLKNNSTLVTSNDYSPSWPFNNFYLLGMNRYYPDLDAYEIQYGTRQLAFATIGRGLSDLQSTNLYNQIQAFQTALNRQVFDSDAQSFITAADITDPTQQTAINTLVVSLKSNNLWTKMRAIYPFVGGTSSTHKFNLKNPQDTDVAYRLVFSGGWTHSSTGAKPNGVNAFANTFLIPKGTLDYASLGYYSRTSTTENGTNDQNGTVIGARSDSDSTVNNAFLIQVKTNPNNYNRIFYSRTNSSTNVLGSFVDAGGIGLFAGSLDVSGAKMYKNGVNLTSSNFSYFRNTPNTPVYVGALNNKNISAAEYSLKESAFAHIGDSLTDTEMANLYTIVQSYQTTLGRQV